MNSKVKLWDCKNRETRLCVNVQECISEKNCRICSKGDIELKIESQGLDLLLRRSRIISQPDDPYECCICESIIRGYNAKFGDSRMCVCGHPYNRHFGVSDNGEEWVCKDCGCKMFEEIAHKE